MREPFLDAICADYRNPTPRLIFADWLDEYGAEPDDDILVAWLRHISTPGKMEADDFSWGSDAVWYHGLPYPSWIQPNAMRSSPRELLRTEFNMAKSLYIRIPREARFMNYIEPHTLPRP